MGIYKRNPSGGSSGFTKRPLSRPKHPRPPAKRRDGRTSLDRLFDRIDDKFEGLLDESDDIMDISGKWIANKMKDIDDINIDDLESYEKMLDRKDRNIYLYKFKAIAVLFIALFLVAISGLFILSFKDNTPTLTPLTQEQSVDKPVLKDEGLNKL